jgi:hypothetical protein
MLKSPKAYSGSVYFRFGAGDFSWEKTPGDRIINEKTKRNLFIRQGSMT